jgi:DNA-binding response OmpR family regulator
MRQVKLMPTVMIAEDDLMVADMLEEVLTERGYDVCGIAHTVDKAVELGERHKPDLAILDIRLAGGGIGTDIPARLKPQGRMGVLYASGHAGQVNLTKADGDALLVKPYRSEDVVRALKIVENIVSTDEDSRRFPKGFSLLTDLSTNDVVLTPAEAELTEKNLRLRRQWAALAGFGRFALDERDLGNVLMEAARVCAECLQVAYCTVYRYRPEENDLLVEAGVGWDQGVIGYVVSRADESSTHGRAFINREPVSCCDLSTDATLGQPRIYAEHGIVTTLDVLIGTVDDPYGVLEISNSAQYDYDDHDIDLLTCFANILAEATNAAKSSSAPRIVRDRIEDAAETSSIPSFPG